MRYLARIAYLGENFCGFQVQKTVRTVQGVLNAATEALFGSACRITGCSRTDSGVHAKEFYLTIEPISADAAVIPPSALPRAIVPYLPGDLSLLAAIEAPRGFHPRHDALGKEYRYRMRFSAIADPFRRGRVWQVPYPLSEEGLLRMQEAAPLLVGKHDFTAFMCADADIEDRVRHIKSLRVFREEDEVVISVTADGFLYNMVRIITGTLFEIGRGTRDADSISAALSTCLRKDAGMTAPPEGLYLHRVFYKDEILKQFLS